MLRAAGKGAVSEKENKTALRMDLTLQEQSFSVGQLCRSAPPLSVESISWLIRLAFGLDYLLVLLWKKLLL